MGSAGGLEAAGGDLIDEKSGGCGEDAVDGEDDPGRCRRVDAEDFEDSGKQQRIERRYPGGWSGVSGEGVCVAVAGDEGAGDAAHLPAELEVVLREADAVGMGKSDVEHAEKKGRPEDGPWCAEGRDFLWCRRACHLWISHLTAAGAGLGDDKAARGRQKDDGEKAF